jgi:hypothetical protein
MDGFGDSVEHLMNVIDNNGLVKEANYVKKVTSTHLTVMIIIIGMSLSAIESEVRAKLRTLWRNAPGSN